MRLTKEEKEELLDLLDVMTDRVPILNYDRFINDRSTRILWNIFKKLRFEVKGY